MSYPDDFITPLESTISHICGLNGKTSVVGKGLVRRNIPEPESGTTVEIITKAYLVPEAEICLLSP
eukprot:9638830-Ditylum_brightwellii.AAC.1